MPQLAKHDMCTGCLACVFSCPRHCLNIEIDEYGFSFPGLFDQEHCINCGVCEKSCPVLNHKELYKSTRAFAAYSLNTDIRSDSSSGGIFSELALEIIDQGGYVYGASYDENFKIHHICVDSKEKLGLLRGAKYAQSNLHNCFERIKKQVKEGKPVLFSGTPCQIAGLKSFLNKDYNNIFFVDFVCHGVPSPMVWEKYVKYRAESDNEGKMPVKINLRSKHTGWSHYKYSNLFIYDNNVRYSVESGSDLFMKLFVGDYINRESCSNCQFKGFKRQSDITIADFWGIWDVRPGMDDGKGTSAVLVHSKKGKQLFNNISKRIKFEEVSFEEISQQNPSILISSKANKMRESILTMIQEGKIEEVKLMLLRKSKKSFMRRTLEKVKRAFGK